MSIVALNDGLVNPKEEMTTLLINQHDAGSSTGVTLAVAAESTGADTDMNIDSDPTEESQFDDVLLDDCSENEDEVDDPKDGDQSDEAVEAAMVGATVDEMDVDEEAATTRPHYGVHKTPLPF